MATESEAVRHHHVDVRIAGDVWRVVEIAVRIGVLEVDRGRDHAPEQGQGTDDQFDAAAGSERVPQLALRAGDRQPPGMVSEHLRRFTNRRPALDESLRKLERLGVIRKKESSDKRGRGKPSTVYEVHPKILEPGSGYSANSANCHTEQENPHSGYSANSGNCPEADEYHENPEYAERGSEEKEVRGGMDI